MSSAAGGAAAGAAARLRAGEALARAQLLLGGILSPDPPSGGPARPSLQAAMIVSASAIFGFQFVVLKAAFHGVGPLTMVALRVFVALPLQLALMRWAGAPLRIPRRDLLLIMLPAALLTGSQFMFMLGVHRLSAGLGSTLGSTAPLITLALGFLTGIERARPVAYAGAIAGIAGVTIATGATSGHGDAVGIVLILGCNLGYAASLLVHRRMALRLSSAWFTTAMLAQTLVVGVPVAVAAEGFHVEPTWQVILAVVYAGVLAQLVGYALQMSLLRYGGAFQTTLVTPLIPVFAILSAVLLLGEPLLWSELAGAALIVGGVLAAVLPPGTAARLLHRPGRP